jgi:hypothetical protein
MGMFTTYDARSDARSGGPITERRGIAHDVR